MIIRAMAALCLLAALTDCGGDRAVEPAEPLGSPPNWGGREDARPLTSRALQGTWYLHSHRLYPADGVGEVEEIETDFPYYYYYHYSFLPGRRVSFQMYALSLDRVSGVYGILPPLIGMALVESVFSHGRGDYSWSYATRFFSAVVTDSVLEMAWVDASSLPPALRDTLVTESGQTVDHVLEALGHLQDSVLSSGGGSGALDGEFLRTDVYRREPRER